MESEEAHLTVEGLFTKFNTGSGEILYVLNGDLYDIGLPIYFPSFVAKLETLTRVQVVVMNRLRYKYKVKGFL